MVIAVALAIPVIGACSAGNGAASGDADGPSALDPPRVTVAEEPAETDPTAGVAVDADDRAATADGAGSGAPAGGDPADDPSDGASGEPADAGTPQVEEGTDSALTDPAGPVSDSARSTVSEFAVAYLSFDYREDDLQRIERLRPLVTEELLASLSTPLPLALAEQLRDEERVEVPEPIDVVAVSPDVYQAVVEVTVETADADDAVERRLVTVVVGADGLVTDVR